MDCGMGGRWWLSGPQRERMGSHCHCFVIRLVFWLFFQSLFPGCSVGWGIFSIFVLLFDLRRSVCFTLGCLGPQNIIRKSDYRKKWITSFDIPIYIFLPGWYITDDTHEQQHTRRLYYHLCWDRQSIIPNVCVTLYKRYQLNKYIYYERKKLKIDLVKWTITHLFGTEDVLDVLDKFFLARWELPTFFCLPGPGTRSRLPCCVFKICIFTQQINIQM